MNKEPLRSNKKFLSKVCELEGQEPLRLTALVDGYIGLAFICCADHTHSIVVEYVP